MKCHDGSAPRLTAPPSKPQQATDDECHRCGTPHRRESSDRSEECTDAAAHDEEMRRMLAAMHAAAGDPDGAL